MNMNVALNALLLALFKKILNEVHHRSKHKQTAKFSAGKNLRTAKESIKIISENFVNGEFFFFLHGKFIIKKKVV